MIQGDLQVATYNVIEQVEDETMRCVWCCSKSKNGVLIGGIFNGAIEEVP